MNFVEIVTADFIGYGFMCAQVAVSIAAALIAIPVFYIINDSYARAEKLCECAQTNYDYDCNVIIRSWCRLWLDKYSLNKVGRSSERVYLTNLNENLRLRIIACQRRFQEIHRLM